MRAAVRASDDGREIWERRAGDACAPLAHYRRREPERTLLHEVVRAELETFLAAARERSEHGRGLPAFVERELRAYVDCGVLARGFARVRCPDCGFERLVAFSCKAHVCPSCAPRRMEDGADHLVRNVLPPVPLRQWVLSLPRRVRFLAARRPALASRLLDVFTRAVFAWQRRCARRTGATEPRTGGVTAIQRFGSALNLNVHFHTLVPDGVFIEEGTGPARFEPLDAPSDEEVMAILLRIVRRTAKLLESVAHDLELDEANDTFASIQAEEVERRPRHPEPFEPTRRSAFLEGYSLHAGVRVHGNDLQRREQLCRYILRPPLALCRLSRSTDGGLLYRMKWPRRGSVWLTLTPAELLAKLATLIPPPRVHGVRYHGVFAPHSRMRRRVVPPDVGAGPGLGPSPSHPPPRTRAPLPSPLDEDRARLLRTYRVPWAELLKKVFAVDVLACLECSGRLKMIAFIADQRTARKILEHLGLDATGPPTAVARQRPESIDATPDYDVADPIYEA
jgi:hypothetical protein